MLRKICFSFMCMTAVISINSYSMENTLLKAQSITMEFEFPPNQTQIFTNYMFWAIEADCKINTEDASNQLNFKAIAKKGKINDIPLSAGQSLQVTVHAGEHLKLSADSGAKVEITNRGKHTVKASCTS